MKVKYGTIIVKDMEESIQFYTDVMGFEVDSRYNPQPGVTITLLKGAKINMEPVPITVGTLAFLEDPNGVRIALVQHDSSRSS